MDSKPQGSTPLLSSAVLPVYQDDEINLCLDELSEIDISHVKKSKISEVTEKVAVAKNEDDNFKGNAGDVFGLNDRG